MPKARSNRFCNVCSCFFGIIAREEGQNMDHKSSYIATVILCFAGAVVCYLDRVGFPLAYTALAAKVGLDKTTQGVVHSSFYNGYTLTQIPGGWASTKLGGRRVLTLAFFLWSIFSLTMPTDASKTGRMILARIMIGASMGVIFPTFHTVLAQCAPVRIRSRVVAFATSGMYFGGACAQAMVPVLINRLGPESVPKVVGGLGVGWMLWMLHATRPKPFFPDTSPSTSTSALASTSASTTTTTLLPGTETRLRTGGKVPWARVMRSMKVWIIVLNNFAFHYAFFVLLSWLPTFQHQVLGVGLEDSGWVGALPYAIMFAASNLGGVAGDFLIQHKLSIGRTRKSINTAGFLCATMALALLPGSETLASTIALSGLALGGLGLARGGFAVNHIDIAPRWAGVIMGFSNGAGSMAGMIGPRLSGWILDHTSSTYLAWQRIFYIPGIICICGAFLFELLATGERVFD